MLTMAMNCTVAGGDGGGVVAGMLGRRHRRRDDRHEWNLLIEASEVLSRRRRLSSMDGFVKTIFLPNYNPEPTPPRVVPYLSAIVQVSISDSSNATIVARNPSSFVTNPLAGGHYYP